MFITDKRQKTSLPVLRDHVQAGTSRCDGSDPGDVQVLRDCCPFKTSALSRGNGEKQFIILPASQREHGRVLLGRFRIGTASW